MKVVLFDFDGTIADSIDTCLQIANQLAAEFGFQPINRAEFIALQSLSSRAILRHLKISPFQVPRITRRFIDELGRELPQVELIPGIKDTLITLRSQGYYLGIVSTNSEKNIHRFLATQHLSSLFDFVSASSQPFFKNRLIRKIIRQYDFNPDRVFYVGDETRDIEAARKSQIHPIAVTWGFNSATILAAHHPDFLIHHPQELLSLLKEIP